MALWTVRADYDADDGVWYVVESDIPGLAVDGETIAELGAKAGAHLPDLLDIHRDDLSRAQRSGPHSLRLVAFHESTIAVAA